MDTEIIESTADRNEKKALSLKRLGEFVRNQREMLGMSVSDLARKISYNESYVRRLEAGEQLGSHDALAAVARGIGVRPGLLTDIYADEPEATILRLMEIPAGATDQDIALLMHIRSLIAELRGGEPETPPLLNLPEGWKPGQLSEHDQAVVEKIKQAQAQQREERMRSRRKKSNPGDESENNSSNHQKEEIRRPQ